MRRCGRPGGRGSRGGALAAGPEEGVRTRGREGSRGRAHLKRERVGDAPGASSHAVTLSRPDYERLTAGRHTPEQFIDAAFRFLLDREPKEAILRRFDIRVIATYFPEFGHALLTYLAGSD